MSKFKDIEKGEYINIAPKLEPLSCSSCGANIPLIDSESTKCNSCGFEVFIPENYRELKKGQIKHQEILKKGNEVYQKISQPPSAFMNFWYDFASIIFGLIGSLFVIFGLIGGGFSLVLFFVTYLSIISLATTFHENYNDTWGPGNIYMILTLGLSLFVVFPLVLNSMIKEFGDLKRILQASLAAKAPLDEKGSFQCRCCGSPLVLKQDDICVSCDYCEAENLASIPESWLKKIQNFSKWHFKTVDEALKLDTTYRNELNGYLKYWVYFTFIFVGLGWCLGNFAAWIDYEKNSPPSWSILNSTEKTLIPDQFTPNNALSIKNSAFEEIKTNGYWIALKYKDKIKLEFTDIPSNFFVNIKNPTSFEEGKIYDNLVLIKNSDNSFSTLYEAPYTGKFMLEMGNFEKSKIKWEIIKN